MAQIKQQQTSILGKGNILSIQSHVSYGHAGNSSATFPMQRLGYNVTSVNTVMFSNHTGYGDWGGCVISTDIINDIISGIERRNIFPHTNAVVSGYMGSPELGDTIMSAVRKVKSANKDAIYICDPVFGDVGRDVFVSKGIPEYFRDVALKSCEICTPNMFELMWLTNTKITNIDEAISAGRQLLNDGARVVLLTSLEHNKAKYDEIEMLAITKDEAFHIITPKIHMNDVPSGSGDATTALFTCHYLDTNGDIKLSLEKTTNGIYEIFKATANAGTWELQIVASGDKIADPEHKFNAEKI